MKQRGPLQRSAIRQLRRGEAVPTSAPRRYPNRDGYIRLRWKVGPGQYVETLEHRVVDGHITEAEHVHHINRDRSDNSPANLHHLSARDHADEHTVAARRRARAMARLYRQGWSTVELGRRYAIHPSTVYRRLVDLGVDMRSKSDYSPSPDALIVADLYTAGRSVASLARQYRMDSGRMARLIREGGATIRRPGRPARSTASDENRVRAIVRRRSGGRCEVCGFAKATNFQHRKAAGQGGQWSAANGLDVCGAGNVSGCHGQIHQNPLVAYANGWSVRSGHDPLTTPALVWVHGGPARVLLHPDGSLARVDDP